MSFIVIKDPKKRDYLATVKKIQQRNLNESAQDLARQDDLRNLFNPVVESTEKSTEAITKELIPMREEIKTLNDRLTPSRKLEGVSYYLDTIDTSKLDKYFGIQQTDEGQYMMDDKEVVLDESSNIHVDGVDYKGTPGLWVLVMLSSPKGYTNEDLVNYEHLAKQTNVMSHPPRGVKRGITRPTTIYKWRYIPQEHGGGIQFLPRDIKGMATKLNLLLAEFATGNTSSTRNEIVYILDELLRRKKITREEY